MSEDSRFETINTILKAHLRIMETQSKRIEIIHERIDALWTFLGKSPKKTMEDDIE